MKPSFQRLGSQAPVANLGGVLIACAAIAPLWAITIENDIKADEAFAATNPQSIYTLRTPANRDRVLIEHYNLAGERLESIEHPLPIPGMNVYGALATPEGNFYLTDADSNSILFVDKRQGALWNTRQIPELQALERFELISRWVGRNGQLILSGQFRRPEDKGHRRSGTVLAAINQDGTLALLSTQSETL